MEKTIRNIKAASINEYISNFSKETQQALEEVRSAIKIAMPDSEETISYAIPAFKHNGICVVYFAGYKNHIGLYPVPSGNAEFGNDFSAYKTSGKGAIQFPLNKPMPVNLIEKIVKFRMEEVSKKKQN